MNEKEIKILDIDKSVENKLLSLGAKKIFDDDIHAIYFDIPDTLRLRKEGTAIKLTHKKLISKDPIKIMDETEITVSDFDSTLKILISLGYKPLRTIHKHRISYKIDDTRFEIDTHLDEFSFIPTFLEIESPDPISWANKLGYSQYYPWSIKDLIKHYQ